MESYGDKPLLLVTGASGYLGSWCVAKAVESGKYKVRGTVRDHTNKEKMDLLKQGYGELFDQIEFVSADIENAEAMKKAVEGVSYIIHVASPIVLATPKNAEKTVIQPAVEGTKNILEACVGSSVKKIVITSSALTAFDYSKGEGSTSDRTDFVAETKDHNPYYISKIRSEKFAYDFMDKLPAKDKTFELVCILPSVITGKLKLPIAGGVIATFMKMAVEGKLSSLPKIYYGHVDVQDCADAHLNALEYGKDGGRYVLSSETYKFSKFAEVIKEEFEPKGYKVKVSELSKCTLWMASWFNVDAKNYLSHWDIKCTIDGSKEAEELKFEYKPMKESVVEMVQGMIDMGFIKKPE
ncbi:unnamed protein product [Moneuplotes crassus]|uniref:NAD-dependent epimerase/dehydratase domain-containing protein n=1 Tax=Euplotes crassus TaxID=5936 RepID=A0AAD1XH89_EUPCR|nr:unnamed protein product [Moneuplotes crassus]